MNATALFHLVAVLAVGIGTGVALRTYGRRTGDSPTAGGGGPTTYALVGIAGAFVGFQMAVVLGLPPIIDYLATLAGALLTLVLWRGP